MPIMALLPIIALLAQQPAQGAAGQEGEDDARQERPGRHRYPDHNGPSVFAHGAVPPSRSPSMCRACPSG